MLIDTVLRYIGKIKRLIKKIIRAVKRFFRWLFHIHHHHHSPGMASNLQHVRISGENNMVKYKLMWVPSVSPFATVQNVKGTINGGAVVIAANLALGTFEKEYTFAEGDVVDWYVETVGDNGRTADSIHDVFTALNESTPLAASGLTHLFIEYVP